MMPLAPTTKPTFCDPRAIAFPLEPCVGAFLQRCRNHGRPQAKAAIDMAEKLGYKAILLTHDFNTANELKDADQIIT